MHKLTSRSIRYLQLPGDLLHEFFNTYQMIPLQKQVGEAIFYAIIFHVLYCYIQYL